MSNYLTNHWNDVTLLKLDPSPGSDGPFIVTQDAIDSNDSSQKVRSFTLRKDGQWVDMLVHYALPETERAQIIFGSVREVMELLGGLPAHPEVLRRELSHEEVAQALAEMEQLNIAAIHDKVRTWKKERENL
jgi:hypothetical protein